MYWNPAGIVNVNTVNLENYYAPWLVETDYYYSTAIVPMGNIGNIGVSYTAITMDEMLVRTVDDPEPDIYGQKFDAGNLDYLHQTFDHKYLAQGHPQFSQAFHPS